MAMGELKVNQEPQIRYWSTDEVVKSTQAFRWQIQQWIKKFGIKPHQSTFGNLKFNHFTKEQVALLHHIKRLILDDKYTIEGAKQKLREAKLI